jgi:hypothetical protein
MKPTIPCFLTTTVIAFLVVYLGTLAGEEAFWKNHQPQLRAPAHLDPALDCPPGWVAGIKIVLPEIVLPERTCDLYITGLIYIYTLHSQIHSTVAYLSSRAVSPASS